MLRWLIPLTLLTCACPALAQYGSSDYLLERYDEDYSYLKNVRSFTDPFDPIKYIPLGADDWYLSLGGQARYRYDYFNNTSFGAGRQDEDGFHLFRFLGHADVHFGPNVRAFVQIDSSLEYGRTGGVRPGDMDNVDFQQAFLDFNLPLESANSVMLRVGRQELAYGAQRLVSPSDWSNVRRTFDGAKMVVETSTDTLEAFIVRPVTVTNNRLNGDDDHTWFSGIYNVTALPDLFPSAGSKLDLYLLALDKGVSSVNAVSSDTVTIGSRFHSHPHPWDMDVEFDGQFGRTGDSSIAAYSIAAEGGYTFSAVMFSPRASLGFDLASGSPNPAHRFNQLFPPLYTYLGHLYLFGRENIIDLHPALALTLNRDVTLTFAEHSFWRQNVNDAVYNLDSQVVRAPSGSHEAFIGAEFDVTLSWQVNRHISAYTGWAHLFTGPFLNDTGAHSDEDFFYLMATMTF